VQTNTHSPGTRPRTMRRIMRRTAVALAALAAAPAATGADAAPTATLSSFRDSPSKLAVLKPGQRTANPCRGHAQVAAFTDTAVSLKIGSRPTGRQGFTFAHPSGGYVIYDAPRKQFFNDTRRRVLVAAWCIT
jgi:ABC-type amino acid transport substrate-binding protein